MIQTKNIVDDLIVEGKPINLNLGGAGEGFRESKLPGFLTVDLREVEGTDIVSDVSDLSMVPSGVVSQIYASNVLEHFPHTKTVDVLKEWRRVLKPGGKLFVSVPDFEACVQLYQKQGLVPWVQFLIWGDQAHALNFHYINFTFASLAFAVNQAGFYDVKRVISLPFGLKDASEIRDTRYGIRVSLNVECVN